MAASYPAGFDTMSDPAANLSGPPLHSTMHNQINDVIEAIEAELGLAPSGADATVAATLAALPSRYAPLAGQTIMLAPDVFDAIGVGTPVLNGGHPSGWLFDQTTEEAVGTILPNLIGWATYNIVVYWANTVGTGGGVAWRSFLNTIAAGGATGAGTVQPIVVTAAGANGVLVKTTAVTGVAVGAAGTMTSLRLGRYPPDAGDNLAGDALLLGVELVRVT